MGALLRSVRAWSLCALALASGCGREPTSVKTDDSFLSGEVVVQGVASDLSGTPLRGVGVTLRTYNEPCGSETEVASWQQTFTGSAGDFSLKGYGMPSSGSYSCLHIRFSPPSATDLVDTTVTGLSARLRSAYRTDVETLTVDVALRSR